MAAFSLSYTVITSWLVLQVLQKPRIIWGRAIDDELVERRPGAAGSACRLVSKQGSPRLARAALCMLFLCVSLCQAFHVLESTLRAVVFQHCVIAHQ